MTMKHRLLSSLLVAAFVSTAGLSFASDKPGVMIYATGGTIAGSAKSATDTTGYTAGALGIDVLLNAVPEIKNVANVSGEQISNVASGDINQAILLKMAKSINAKLSERDTNGVVITHGTDTTSSKDRACESSLTIWHCEPSQQANGSRCGHSCGRV